MTETIYGIHTINTLLQHAAWRVKKLLLNREREDKRMQEIIKLAKAHNIATEYTQRARLDKINPDHQGAVAYITPIKIYSEHDLATVLEKQTKPPVLVAVDEISDPHNLGAIARSCLAFNIAGLVFAKHRSAKITATVHKVSCGASLLLPIFEVSNLARFLTQAKKMQFHIYGLDSNAELPLRQQKIIKPAVLIFGAEGKGIRISTRELCDTLLKIPMSELMPSLNVSVACGVVVYQVMWEN